MKTLSIAIFFLISLSVCAQSGTRCDVEQQLNFKHFRSKYKSAIFPKFWQNTTMQNGKFKFCNSFVSVDPSDSLLVLMVSSGLIYPQLLSGDSTCAKDSSKALLFGSKTEVRFAGLEKVRDNRTPLSSRRYSVWMFRAGLLNPQVVLFELTNKNSMKMASDFQFVKGSVLTYFQLDRIVI